MLRDLPPGPRSLTPPSYPRIAAAIFALALAACGDDTSTSDVGPGGAPPNSFGGSAGSADAGKHDAAGSGGDSGSAPKIVDGLPCQLDSECTSYQCLQAGGDELAGGSPPNGMCARGCTDFLDGLTSDNPCTPGTVCVATSADPNHLQAWCLPTCGPADAKCPRTDLACVPQGETGVCMPLCESDSQCGLGVCVRATGLCAPKGTAVGTAPVGSPCDPSAKPDPCAGACHPVASKDDAGPPSGICSRPCIVGSNSCASDNATCVSATPESAWGTLGTCQPL